jgi:hypothetical protein
MTTNPHDLEALIADLERINLEQRQLLEQIDQHRTAGTIDRSTLDELNKTRGAILERLIEIGTIGAELAQGEPVIAHAIEGLVDRLRDSFHELAHHISELEPLDTATPTAETPDPLEQVRELIDNAAESIRTEQGELLDELIPMIEEQISSHFGGFDGEGIEFLGIEIGTPRPMENKSGTSIPCSIASMRSFSDGDEFVETMLDENALEALVKIVKEGKTQGKLNALGVVAYARVRKLRDDNAEPSDDDEIVTQCRVVLIIHPQGLDSWTHFENGDETHRERLIHATGDQDRDLEQLRALDERGRVPLCLVRFYVRLMEKLGH